MSKSIDPFADDEREFNEVGEEKVINNRLGMSNVRQALSRWWIMLIFGVLGYFGALYYMSIKPPSNEAVAVLEVDIKHQELLGRDIESTRLTPEIALATVASKITGPAILAAVAESAEVQALQNAIPPKLSLKPRYWRSDEDLAFQPASSVEVYELVDKMTKSWVSVSPKRNTSLIAVTVNHPDAETARVIADTILKVYMEREEEQLTGGSSDVYKVLKQESDEALTKIENAEKSLQVYVSAMALNKQIQELRPKVVLVRQRYKSKHPTRIHEEAVYGDLLKRFRKEIKRSSTKASERAHWMEHKEELAELEKTVAAGGEEAQEAADEWLAIAQNALSARASLLNADIAQARLLEQNIAKRMTEIDVAGQKNNLNDLKIAEPAYIGMAKDSVRLIYLAAGSVLGVFAGFGLAYLLSVIDYKIYDVRSAEEATGLNCLAAIPASSKFVRAKEWKSILTHDANSSNAEAIRNLRASIVLLGKKERNKLLLVTSAIPAEGKTVTSVEMAAAFAMNKEKTLIMDMDLRRPRLSEAFPQVKGKKGIVDVLAGQAEFNDVICETEVPNLVVVGSGNKAPNPSELLHEGDVVELLKGLCDQYDRIILDSAPVLPVSDSRVLSKHAHTVVLVTRSRKTPVGALIRAKVLLEKAGAKIGGVVVNGMKRTGGSKYYGYRGFGEYGEEQYGYYGGED